MLQHVRNGFNFKREKELAWIERNLMKNMAAVWSLGFFFVKGKIKKLKILQTFHQFYRVTCLNFER